MTTDEFLDVGILLNTKMISSQSLAPKIVLGIEKTVVSIFSSIIPILPQYSPNIPPES